MNKNSLLAFLFILTPFFALSQKTIKIDQCNAVNDANSDDQYLIVGRDSFYSFEKRKFIFMNSCTSAKAPEIEINKDENREAEFNIGNDIYTLRARKTDNNKMSLFLTDNDSTTKENELSELDWSRDRMIFLPIKSLSDELGGVLCPVKDDNTYECTILIFNRQKKLVAKVPFYRDFFDFQFFNDYNDRFVITSDGILLHQFVGYLSPNNKINTLDIISGKKDSIEIKHPDYKVSDYRLIIDNSDQVVLFTVCFSKSTKRLCKGFLVKKYISGQKKFSEGVFSAVPEDAAARYGTNPKKAGLPDWNEKSLLVQTIGNGSFLILNIYGPPTVSAFGSAVTLKNDLRILLFDSTLQLKQHTIVFRNTSRYVEKDENNMGTYVYDGYIKMVKDAGTNTVAILFNSSTTPRMDSIRSSYPARSGNELTNYMLSIKSEQVTLYQLEPPTEADIFVRDSEIHFNQNNLIVNILYSNNPRGSRVYFGRLELLAD
jgi:hypothetical protein